MAFYFARIWLTDSAAKLVLIAAVLVAKISAANKGFTNRYFSYMDENDISFNEERARADKEYTIKLNDGGAFFVARYWGANDLRNLMETLAELFNFRPDVEEIQQ